MITSESAINIDNSAFSENTADSEVHSGVMVTYRDLLSISGTTFTNNMGSWGGIMLMFDSSFHLIDGTFTNNSVTLCGIM